MGNFKRIPVANKHMMMVNAIPNQGNAKENQNECLL